MPTPANGRMLLFERKEAAVHHWMNGFDWTWVGALMIAWILLIALIGYAAALVAWRHSDDAHTQHRRPKSA